MRSIGRPTPNRHARLQGALLSAAEARRSEASPSADTAGTASNGIAGHTARNSAEPKPQRQGQEQGGLQQHRAMAAGSGELSWPGVQRRRQQGAGAQQQPPDGDQRLQQVVPEAPAAALAGSGVAHGTADQQPQLRGSAAPALSDAGVAGPGTFPAQHAASRCASTHVNMAVLGYHGSSSDIAVQ